MSRKRKSVNWQYALGEVVLIFIGISLAIGFQNWNDDRRLKIEADSVLHSLNENLSIVSGELDSLRKTELTRIAIYEALISPAKRSDFLKTDSIDQKLWTALFAIEVAIPKFTAYEEFKNSGQLSLIEDSKLNKMMINLEFQLDDMRTTIADRLFVQQTMMDPLIVEHFNVPHLLGASYNQDYQADLPPTDYVEALAYPQIQNALAYKVALALDHVEDLYRVLEACEEMIERLDQLIE